MPMARLDRTLKGLSRYIPSGQAAPRIPTPVVITALRFGERVRRPRSLSEIPFRDRNFLVTFAGLSFLSEKNIRFRYRLEGLDDRWIETTQREAQVPQPAAGRLSLPGCGAERRWPLESGAGHGLLSYRAALVGHLVVSIPGGRRAAPCSSGWWCAPA